MKKTFTWWVGWVVLFPFRFLFVTLLNIATAASPEMFYGFMNETPVEKDPNNWRLK